MQAKKIKKERDEKKRDEKKEMKNNEFLTRECHEGKLLPETGHKHLPVFFSI